MGKINDWYTNRFLKWWKNDKFFRWILVPSIIISLLSLTSGIAAVKWGGWNFSDLGPFGDFIAGSTVPVFTLASSIGLIITLRMQKQQLEVQRKELQNSIDEMQETRKVMIEQGETMTLQRFESTFFNMINLHNTIIKSLSTMDGLGQRITERESFKVFLDKIRAKHITYPHQGQGMKAVADKLNTVYGVVYHDNEPTYGQYFRNLNTLIRFVDTSEISEENKDMYMEIIKSQLSSIESTVLMYHAISRYGRGILPIMRKYDLIANYDSKLVLNDGDMDFYIFKNEKL